MKTIGKAVSLVMAALIMFGMLAACNGSTTPGTADNSGTGGDSTAAAPPAAAAVTLKLWGSQEDQAMLNEMVAAFKAANPDKTYDIQLGVVSEADAATRVLEDPAAAADVFVFANDQIRTLVKAGALYEVTRNKDAIIAANMPSSIEACEINGELYAYPMTADNGYFLYYDKSVLSDSDVATLDGIMAKANAAGKKVFMDVSNGYYIASFFLGAGCKLEIGADEKQICDFNSATGVQVGEAIKAFTADPAFNTGDDAVLTSGIGTTICAAVSGIWNASAIEGILGDNFGATKLPTFTLDGKQVQMGGFAGFKLLGVNSSTASPLDAMALAEWLINEENQIKRYEVRGMGPSNLNAGASQAVKDNIPLAALGSQYAFASSQKDVLGSYWGPAEAFGTAMEAKDYGMSIQEQLDAMVAQITQ
ncbi:MAG: extracellular solute-binding protein [Clostridiales bacterium]|jgi:arabinogalactan oligomer/maltooligosaccharide transport system substrate-binding protein|nr:extracellular solute-binding protein [Clostridiales bacterium]